MQALITLILSHPRKITLALTLAIFLVATQGIYIEQVADTSQLIVKTDPEYIKRQEMVAVFPDDGGAILVSDYDKPLEARSLEQAYQVVTSLQSAPEVNDVISLFSEPYVGQNLEISPIIGSPPYAPDVSQTLKARLDSNTAYRGLLVSSVDDNLIITVRFKPGVSESKMKHVFAMALDSLGEEKPNWRYSGFSMVNAEIKERMDRDLLILSPLMIIVLSLLIYGAFRSLIVVGITICTFTIGLMLSVGFMGAFNISLNVVTHTVPFLIIAIGTSYSIHLMSQYAKSQQSYETSIPHSQRLTHTLIHIWPTLAMTGLTTIAGFLGNLMSPVPTIGEFGLVVTVGILGTMIAAMVLVPATLTILDSQGVTLGINAVEKKSVRIDRLLASIEGIVITYKKRVLIVTCVVVSLAVPLYWQVTSNYYILGYFAKDSSVVQDAKTVAKHAGGVADFTIVLDSGRAGGVKDVKILRAIDDSLAMIKAKYPDDIKVTLSFASYIKKMSESLNDDPAYYRLPKDNLELEQYLEVYSWSSNLTSDLRSVVDPSFRYTKISGRFAFHESSQGMVVETPIQHGHKISLELAEFLTRSLSDSVRVVSYGTVPIWTSTLNQLVANQKESIVLAISLVLILTFVALRSIKYALASIVPVVIGLVFNFALMALLNIELDIATSLVSALIIGVGIDDSLHFILTFRRNLHLGLDKVAAIRASLQGTGRAILVTSGTLVCGFGVMCASSFLPIVYFGFLNVCAIIVATVATLLVLPPLLLVLEGETKLNVIKEQSS